MTPYVSGVAGTVQTTTNIYDALNELTQTTTTDSKIITIVYNEEGIRVAKTSNGVNRKYLYEGDKVVLEVDVSGNVVAKNVYGTNLLTRTVGGVKGYYFYNGHADTTNIPDETGAAINNYYYDEFGVLTSSTGTFDNPYTYSGNQYDSETKTYYLMARVYDPSTGTFLQEDSYRGDHNDPLSLNYYTYCKGNPLIYSDQNGHRGMVGCDEDETPEERQESFEEMDATNEITREAEESNKADTEVYGPVQNNDSVNIEAGANAEPQSIIVSLNDKGINTTDSGAITIGVNGGGLYGPQVQTSGIDDPITGLNNTVTVANKASVIYANTQVKTSSSMLERIGTGVSDFVLPTTTEDMKAVNLAEEALDHGSKGVKVLTGAETVSAGKEILAGASVVGKFGKVAGLIGTVLTSIVEIGNSSDSFKDDLELIKQYDPDDYNEALVWSKASTLADTCSFGYIRSFANTIPSLVQLVPGKDPQWTDGWIGTVNKYGNAISLDKYVGSLIK